MTLHAAVDLLRLLAAILAVAVARRRPAHRSVAAFLVLIVISSFVRTVMIRTGVVPSAVPPEPLTGLARVAGHFDQSIYLLWPWGVAALTIRVFADRRPWPVGLAYVATIAGLVASYPAVREAGLARVYTEIELLSLIVSVGCVVQWFWRHKDPTITHAAAGMILTLELSTLLGPYRGNLFTDWDRARAIYIVLYAALAFVQGGSLWGSRSTSKSV
jgi:hypothetical protein